MDAAGTVRFVQWDGPAFRAGLAPGARIRQVNGQPFGVEALKAAVASQRPVQLEVAQDGATLTINITSPGLRYPRLQRIGDGPSALDDILRPRG